jgi:hypothetical protein
MEVNMGLFDFLYKHGAPGQTARTVIAQYLKLKDNRPNIEDHQIMRMIVEVRHAAIPYRPDQLERLEKFLQDHPSLFKFIVKLIEIDTDAYADIPVNPDGATTYAKIKQGIEKVVKEEFKRRKLDISE